MILKSGPSSAFGKIWTVAYAKEIYPSQIAIAAMLIYHSFTKSLSKNFLFPKADPVPLLEKNVGYVKVSDNILLLDIGYIIAED